MRSPNPLLWLLTVVFAGFTACDDSEAPSGRLIGYGSCKTFSGGAGAGQKTSPPTESCVEYDYDGGERLALRHTNAAFNCCPGAIETDIQVSTPTIRVTEREQQAQCHCNCLYDLELEIRHLEPADYLITFVEPYLGDQGAPLTSTLPLTRQPQGRFCVARHGYPWGES